MTCALCLALTMCSIYWGVGRRWSWYYICRCEKQCAHKRGCGSNNYDWCDNSLAAASLECNLFRLAVGATASS